MQKKLLTIFTRTALHVGAGSTEGAIDNVIQREKQTGFPIVRAKGLKGVLADLWPDSDHEMNREGKRVRKRGSEAEWLFGRDCDPKNGASGALLPQEGQLLAFPVRSAKGAYAWTTCPTTLARFARDKDITLGGIPFDLASQQCHAPNELRLAADKLVLDENDITAIDTPSSGIVAALESLVDDVLWKDMLKHKLVILSDDDFKHYAMHACEIATHNRINDQTQTCAHGALFNQENVPSETLFCVVVDAHAETGKDKESRRTPENALNALAEKLKTVNNVLQLGADETTGLGYCSVAVK